MSSTSSHNQPKKKEKQDASQPKIYERVGPIELDDLDLTNRKFELADEAIRKRKEEKYFKREFAKDVKKMRDPPKEKTDVFDKLADGDINLDEFFEIMEHKKSKSRGRNGTKKVNQTARLSSKSKQRLSHFFAPKEEREKEG